MFGYDCTETFNDDRIDQFDIGDDFLIYTRMKERSLSRPKQGITDHGFNPFVPKWN